MNIPDTALTDISNYLGETITSRALFAAALTAPSSTQPSDASKVVVASAAQGRNNVWNEIDFKGMQSVASRLSDDDLASILLCIDAVNNLKILKLAHCINITGTGLECLRASNVLEEIDLSLMSSDESTDIDTESRISDTVVFHILDDIFGRDENLSEVSLNKLKLHAKWRRGQNAVLDAFLERHDVYHCVRDAECLGGCKSEFDWPESSNRRIISLWNGGDRSKSNTCADCDGYYCESCRRDIEQCGKCKEYRCVECQECGDVRNPCNECDKSFCCVCDVTVGWCEECYGNEDYGHGVCEDCFKPNSDRAAVEDHCSTCEKLELMFFRERPTPPNQRQISDFFSKKNCE